MGRPREFDTDAALDQCMHLFCRQGYEGTSLDDLSEATGLTRASIYNAFGSKKGLCITCIDRFARDVIGPQLAHIENSTVGPLVAIENFLTSLFSDCTPIDRIAGCLLNNTVIEVTSQGDPELFRTANAPMLFVEGLLAGRLAALTDDCRTVAHFILCNIQGVRVMAKRGAESSEINALIDMLMISVRALCERKTMNNTDSRGRRPL